MSEIGFPPRPVSAGELRDHLIAGGNDIGTPKLNGHRVLVNAKTGEMFNRKKEPYSYATRPLGGYYNGSLHHQLNYYSESKDILWYDVEYIHHGENKGKCVIIDVCTGDTRDYHARRKLLAYWTEADPISSQCLLRETVSKMPVYTTHKDIIKAYDDMKETYLEFAETGQEGSYLWEGIVTVWTEPPYELTLRQSENLHTMCKNRFR